MSFRKMVFFVLLVLAECMRQFSLGVNRYFKGLRTYNGYPSGRPTPKATLSRVRTVSGTATTIDWCGDLRQRHTCHQFLAIVVQFE